ncbi:hypothetical protein [Aliivibrio sp. SR45-2]|uniref:hypothetical protein n=1 Tax=Aliivibrio sp. SR45-2 TaxID=2760931 RepID=UPI0015F9C1EA|nr:hypothetical protein [Aliivibrio sp. SR45-2]MBB1315827.1 hypothetical protein [Aliivibrio sp. SR45-2]
MKTLLSSLSTTFQQRLSNPLIGSFILSWTAINIKIIVNISSLTGLERVKYIDTLYFDFESDLFLPIVMSLFYIFIIPLIQRWVDRAKYRLVDKDRKSDKNVQLSGELKSLSKINEQQSKSTLDYWSKVQDKNLERESEIAKLNLTNWISERDELNSKVTELSKELKNKENESVSNSLKLNKEIDMLNERMAFDFSKIEHVKSFNNNYNVELSHLESDFYKYKDLYDYIESIRDSLSVEDRQSFGNLSYNSIGDIGFSIKSYNELNKSEMSQYHNIATNNYSLIIKMLNLLSSENIDYLKSKRPNDDFFSILKEINSTLNAQENT